MVDWWFNDFDFKLVKLLSCLSIKCISYKLLYHSQFLNKFRASHYKFFWIISELLKVTALELHYYFIRNWVTDIPQRSPYHQQKLIYLV